MRKLVLASLAAAALSIPAMAQNSQPNDTQNQPQQQQVNQQPSENQNQQQAQNTVDPSKLSTQQIRQIQISLNKQGFDAGHADGKWGPETEKALKDFQQQRHMQASGQLDQRTLQALGVNMSAQNGNAQQPAAQTTGQGSRESQPQRMQNNMQQQNPSQQKQ